ncbi:MAG: chemotaxis protein CheX [Planctomycetes bacterium]|nr:chemotaxis protein CheX [Planctomycetota bacterium]
METTSTLLDTIVKETIASTQEIFSTMIPMEITPGETFTQNEGDVKENVMSLVSFSGEHSGIISLFCSKIIALKITSLMLGMDVTELDHDTKDAIGEVTNMIAGSLKNKVHTELGAMHLAVPVVVGGTDITLSSSSKGRETDSQFPDSSETFGNPNMWVMSPFTTGDGTFNVGIKINP